MIEPYIREWYSSVVAVHKLGPGQNLRFCIDYCQLNKLCKVMKFRFPTIMEIVNSLGNFTKVLKKYALAKGYLQVTVAAVSQGYLAFVVRKDTWGFVRRPFESQSTPAIFQAMMQNILDELSYVVCFVYNDDTIVFGKDEKECLENSSRVWN